MKNSLYFLSVICLLVFFVFEGTAEARKRRKKQKIDQFKQQYWEQEANYDVVQGRLYPKSGKVQFSLFGGSISTDPFLTVSNAGGSLGYHFNEFVSLHLLGWKTFAHGSDALKVLENDTSATANTNIPKSYFGSEVGLSVIYGKLSVLGKAIVHYDLYGLGGAGLTQTESGSFITPHIGVGQQVYLSKSITFRMNFRLTHYREKIVEKNRESTKGQVIGTRGNTSSVFTMGFGFLFGN